MNAQDLRDLLEKSSDRLSIFKDREKLIKYNFNVFELVNLVNDFLDDNEKVELFETNHFKNTKSIIKMKIINSISDEKLRLELFSNTDITSNFSKNEMIGVIENLNDDLKVKFIKNPYFLSKCELNTWEKVNLLKKINQESRNDILLDTDYIKDVLKLENYKIPEIICSIEDEDKKLNLIDKYEFKSHEISDIFTTFSDKSKLNILFENKYDMDKSDFLKIITTLSTESLNAFIKNNKDFIKQNNIEIYEITKKLSIEKQADLISNLNNLDLNEKQLKQVIVNLKEETKEEINIEIIPHEYRELLNFEISDETESYGKIILDFNVDLEKYKDLDNLLYVNPMEISDEDREKLLELCDICPEMKINDGLNLSYNTVEEYKNSEKWIQERLSEIDENWNQIQKIAHIDNAIGKKISYSPDFDTEVFSAGDSRALWRIIDSGYGVCNGISQVEKYIFDRIGIESELISSGSHAFLKLKNISLPNEEGEYISGDTILDPTWNLAAHRFGGKPDNFCKSYEEIRKHDIDSSGKDRMCHKNDEELESATLNLDEKYLREIFSSIGIADRDGNFPVKEIIDKSESIYDSELSEEEKITKQFELIEEYCPEFATCQNSTTSILEGLIFDSDNIEFNRCVVNRVYERDDENKEAVLYTYLDLPNLGKKFYFADKESGKFLEVSQQEFEKRFECYEEDMEKLNGHRAWEDIEKVEELEDLTKSSGKVVATEGEER